MIPPHPPTRPSLSTGPTCAHDLHVHRTQVTSAANTPLTSPMNTHLNLTPPQNPHTHPRSPPYDPIPPARQTNRDTPKPSWHPSSKRLTDLQRVRHFPPSARANTGAPLDKGVTLPWSATRQQVNLVAALWCGRGIQTSTYLRLFCALASIFTTCTVQTPHFGFDLHRLYCANTASIASTQTTHEQTRYSNTPPRQSAERAQ